MSQSIHAQKLHNNSLETSLLLLFFACISIGLASYFKLGEVIWLKSREAQLSVYGVATQLFGHDEPGKAFDDLMFIRSTESRATLQKLFDEKYRQLISLVPKLGMGILIVAFFSTLQPRGKLNFNTFLKTFSRKWPWLNAYRADKPLEQSPLPGSTYAHPMSPATFLTKQWPSLPKKHHIYEEPINHFNEKLAHTILAKQLDNGNGLEGRFKRIYSNGKLNLTRTLEHSLSKVERKLVEEFLPNLQRSYEISPVDCVVEDDGKWVPPNAQEQKMADLIGLHQFTRTFMMSFFESCNKKQYVTLSSLPWLRKQDRVLFLALSSVGRNETFVESAGCFSHWVAEKHIKKANGITEPQVFLAINALKSYVDELKGD